MLDDDPQPRTFSASVATGRGGNPLDHMERDPAPLCQQLPPFATDPAW
jgi:hypothetical protein